MTIGDDIKETLEDVGTAYTVLRDSGNVSGEYLDYLINRQITKPFIREFFLEASLSYDTGAIAGDVVQFDTTEDVYLIMNKTPELFENSIVTNECTLYKANVSGELLRPSETRDTQYHKIPEWQTVKSNCYALQTEALYGHDLDTDEELGLLRVENHELYIPHSIGIQLLDRFEPSSGEFYRVETIKKRRYSNVDVCELGEDTR